ncbi:hypothetical protein EA187_08750 [Lujinxingia sediminis]|uniref:Exo-alpha-sialidase n=1 Tax=Lujinxingia sediminis TaxID=2480984 RepID=A0ABY0CU94_9DELT|nr:hypothetical protein [Lujinxingia sediminis]RVU45837.1 hypothetical protein EA187_08750 [Lujinxingia sediminis]
MINLLASVGRRPAPYAALAAATLLSASPTLHAHGAPPRARQAFALTDPGGGDVLWALSTNFGVMSQSAPSRYICEEAFEAGETYIMLPVGPERWVSLGEDRVALSEAGCQIEVVHTYALPPVDAAHRAASDEVIVALADATGAQLHYSSDAGRTWSKLAVDLSDLRPTGVRFWGEGQVALSAFRTPDARRGEAVVAHIDLRAPAPALNLFELPAERRYPYLLAAADGQLLWHAQGPDAQEVYWSALSALPDAGAPVFELDAWPAAGALSTDGERAWLSGSEDNPGIFTAERTAPAQPPELWHQLPSEHHARCLTPTAEGLLICGHRATDGFDLARLDEAGEVEPLVDFRELQGPQSACRNADDTANLCQAVWPELARSLGIDPDVFDDVATDASPPDVGNTSDASESPGQAGEPGCAQAGGSIGAGWWAMIAIALLSARRRRR